MNFNEDLLFVKLLLIRRFLFLDGKAALYFLLRQAPDILALLKTEFIRAPYGYSC